MNLAFCQCGRAHTWPPSVLPYFNNNMAVCPCGKILEPQTQMEFEAAQKQHSSMIWLIVDRLKELE